MWFVITLFSVFSVFSPKGEDDFEVFFEAYKTDSEVKLDAAIITFSTGKEKHDVYVAALKMKKAGVIKNTSKKIELFKEGKIVLEKNIQQSPGNLEWRFIRLTIQENAPPIVRYKDNLNEDQTFIYKNYKNASKKLQKIILGYAAISEYLDVDQLQ